MTMETFADQSIHKSKVGYCKKVKCHGDCVIMKRNGKINCTEELMSKKKTKLKIEDHSTWRIWSRLE